MLIHLDSSRGELVVLHLLIFDLLILLVWVVALVAFWLSKAHSCRIKIVLENFFRLRLWLDLLLHDNTGRFFDSFIWGISHALVLLNVCSPFKISLPFFVSVVKLELAILRIVLQGWVDVFELSHFDDLVNNVTATLQKHEKAKLSRVKNLVALLDRRDMEGFLLQELRGQSTVARV